MRLARPIAAIALAAAICTGCAQQDAPNIPTPAEATVAPAADSDPATVTFVTTAANWGIKFPSDAAAAHLGDTIGRQHRAGIADGELVRQWSELDQAGMTPGMTYTQQQWQWIVDTAIRLYG